MVFLLYRILYQIIISKWLIYFTNTQKPFNLMKVIIEILPKKN